MRKTLVYCKSRADCQIPLAIKALIGLCLAVGCVLYKGERPPHNVVYPVGFGDANEYYNSTHCDFTGVWGSPPGGLYNIESDIILFVHIDGTFESWKAMPTAYGRHLLSYTYREPATWTNGPLKGINLTSPKYWVISSSKGKWEWLQRPGEQDQHKEGIYRLPQIRFSQPIDPDDPNRLPQVYSVCHHPSKLSVGHPMFSLQSPARSYEFGAPGYPSWGFSTAALANYLPREEGERLEVKVTSSPPKPAAHPSAPKQIAHQPTSKTTPSHKAGRS